MARPPEKSAGVFEREVRVSGYPIRYRVMGEGEPVVLVHGLSGSSGWWRRNAPAFAEHYQVFLLDLPGFGAMRRQRRRFALAEAAAWLLSWMEAVGLAKAHLVGHSMGDYISIKLAAERPEAVDRLVLVAPAGVPAGRTMLGHLGPLLLTARRVAPGFLPVLAYDALRMGPFTLWRAARDLLAGDLREDLRDISAPTLLAWGERDPLIPPSVGTLLRHEIPDSRLLILDGAGHVPMFDRPEEFNGALLAFLAGEAVGE